MIEVKFTCNDCGKSFVVKASASYQEQDGRGAKDSTHTIGFNKIILPIGWKTHDIESRCEDCAEAYSEKMRPVWKVQNEARVAAVFSKFKNLWNADRKGLVEELRNFGPLNDTRQQEKMQALIACLEE